MIQRNIQIQDSQILLAILYFFHVKKTKILDKKTSIMQIKKRLANLYISIKVVFLRNEN